MEESPNLVPLHYSPTERQVSPDLEQYKHILIWANALPRYQKVARYHHERLLVRGNEHGFDVDMELTEPTLEDNKNIITDLDPATIIAIVGGDGTASMAMRAAYELGLDNPFMILNGGNAKNQGRMHHHSRHFYRPERILRSGHIRQVYPLVESKTFPYGSTQTDLAFAYTTKGLTAKATAGFNTPGHRVDVEDAPNYKRAIEEAKITIEALRNTVPFIIHEQGKAARVAAEYGLVSGELMAKYMRFPANSFAKEAVVVEAPDVKPLTVGRTVVSLALPFARHRHDWLAEGEQFEVKLVSIDGSDIYTESDGDASTDPSGTSYSYSISDKSVNVISSRS